MKRKQKKNGSASSQLSVENQTLQAVGQTYDEEEDLESVSEKEKEQEEQEEQEEQQSALIIGLGLYGSTLAIKLTELGWYVLGVDTNAAVAEPLASKISGVRIIDGIDQKAIKSLEPSRFSVCICAMGEESVQALTFTIFNLKACDAKCIISRSVDADHNQILSSLGADVIVNPEKEFALSLSETLHRKGSQWFMNHFTSSQRPQLSTIKLRDEDKPKSISSFSFFKLVNSTLTLLLIMGALSAAIAQQNAVLRSHAIEGGWYQSQAFLATIVALVLVWTVSRLVTSEVSKER